MAGLGCVERAGSGMLRCSFWQRICIAGASYGGYATLMGLVSDPTLFRCGINWVGVTDIGLLYSVAWSDFSDVFNEGHGWDKPATQVDFWGGVERFLATHLAAP